MLLKDCFIYCDVNEILNLFYEFVLISSTYYLVFFSFRIFVTPIFTTIVWSIATVFGCGLLFLSVHCTDAVPSLFPWIIVFHQRCNGLVWKLKYLGKMLDILFIKYNIFAKDVGCGMWVIKASSTKFLSRISWFIFSLL